MNITDQFDTKFGLVNSWNNTYRKKAIIIYPSNLDNLKKLINKIKNEKKKFVIKTGKCSYDSKSINPDDKTFVISLKKFNKIISINEKKKFIIVQSGAMISNVINTLKHKNLTLYSVPGGEHISIGGAISANVIGKDSSKKISSFGDSVDTLKVLNKNGIIKKINKKSKKLNQYIGSFGMLGIITQVKLKVKKIQSPNLELTTKILNSLSKIKKELNKKADYKYIQIDPFFRKQNFSVVFSAVFTKNSKNLYKNINFKSYFLEKVIFRISSLFINSFTWKMFYKLFFLINKNKKINLDIHNYHYPSKYKHMVPLICKKGLIDYELLIKKDFEKKMIKIFNFLRKNKLIPIYIVIKKIFKSKRKFFYQFNDDGYAVAISLDREKIGKSLRNLFYKFILNQKLKLNLSKSDEQLLKITDVKNNLFMSLYKKMILNNNGLSRKRIRNF
jgi:UDP-N-acetylenolpyruvoylglucosamine reductase|tara:strand:+ start:113 stop:1447 length:1335 start_codon:yes stop_codon:yes gene_type:complete